MEGEITPQAKGPTLEEVNAHLLGRLDTLIQDAQPEEVLVIANAVAKLNASSRNNDLVANKVSEEQREAEENKSRFGHLSEGELV